MSPLTFSHENFPPLPYYRAEWCQPRSGQLVPCRGGDKAFISQTQQLPSCVAAGGQKTPFHATDRNEMYSNLSQPWNKIPCLPFSVHTGECKTELRQHFFYKELAGWDLEVKEWGAQNNLGWVYTALAAKQKLITLAWGTSPLQDGSWIGFWKHHESWA